MGNAPVGILPFSTRNDQLSSRFDVWVGKIAYLFHRQIIAGVIDDRFRADLIKIRHAIEPLASRPDVHGAINGHDDQFLTREDHVRVVADVITIGPKDGLR